MLRRCAPRAARRAGALALVLAAVVPACAGADDDAGSPGDPVAVPAPPSDLAWQGCGSGVECAAVDVPLVHAGADGRTISLQLARRPAGDPDRRVGALLVNPGGPGEPGTNLVRAAGRVFSEGLLDRFDLVSWDPRGTGGSAGIDCVDDLDLIAAPDPTPDDRGERDALAAAWRRFAEACRAAAGDVLPHVSTADSARDMDLVRAALGEEQVTYLGFSYGSELGATYASLFPERVRALALDGALDPSADGEELSRQQALGNELALDRFLAWCDDGRRCRFAEDADPGEAFDALLASLDARPVPAEGAPGRPPVGQGFAYLAVIRALYHPSLWPALDAALARAADGDGRGLLDLADDYMQRGPDGTYTNTLEAFTAISCLDMAVPRDLAAADRFAEELAAEAPRLGRLFAYNDACATWPVDPVARVPLDTEGAGPILIVAATGDSATPYASSQLLVERLEGARLLTREGDGHTSYRPDVDCVTDAVDAFLVDLTLPPEGTRCRG